MRPDPGGQRGVSLLEFVLGLAILAIVLLGATLFFAGQPRQLDPVFQFRAVSLAEALSERLFAVKYDEKNQPEKQHRCDANCTKDKAFGVDGSERQLGDFDDVDDFHLWCADGAIDGEQLATQLGLAQPRLYRRFVVESCVTPGTDAEGQSFKQVTIGISIGGGAPLAFTLHRYNLR